MGIEIISLYGRTIHTVDADTLCYANLNNRNLYAANLRGADLQNIDLRGADLRAADLRHANLIRADLRGALLEGARLCYADLHRADLSGADLRGAFLHGVDLVGTNLAGIKMDWQSHDLIGWRLFYVAGEDVGKRKLAGLILVSTDWCWDKFLALDDPLKEWALEEMAKWVTPDDGAPDEVAAYVK